MLKYLDPFWTKIIGLDNNFDYRDDNFIIRLSELMNATANIIILIAIVLLIIWLIRHWKK